jgi:hypothetical protein
MGNELDSSHRANRAMREAYIQDVVMTEGKIGKLRLYGTLRKRFPGVAYRTFEREYLLALSASEDVIISTNSSDTFVYSPEAYWKERQESKKQSSLDKKKES